MIIEAKKYGSIDYVMSFPDEFNGTENLPLIIFLHGAGTRGNNISDVVENPFFKTIGNFTEFDFIVAAPQCNADTWFDIFSELIDFVRHTAQSRYVDRKRIYGIGASMGGYGIWQLAMSCPEYFAAIIPICGGGMYWNAARLKNIPVLAFHGDSDTVVDVSESIKMVEAVNKIGGNAALTIYKNCGHDAWSRTYADTDVFRQLLTYKKENGTLYKCEFDNSKNYG